MRKSKKILLVAAAAVLLCAFLLLGALYLEGGGYWADGAQEHTFGASRREEPEEGDNEKDGETAGDPESDPQQAPPGESGADALLPTPAEPEGGAGTPSVPTDPPEPEAAVLEIRVLDVAVPYPTMELYFEVYYEGTADFVSGLPLDIFRVEQLGSEGAACEVLAASQLSAAASPVGKDCYMLSCAVPEAALENRVKLEIVADVPRYEGRAAVELPRVVLPEEALKPDEQYVVVRADVSWEDAARLAEEQGGYLVDINSEAEYRQILALAEEADLKVFWAGARIGSVEDDWAEAQWITGKPMEFVDWYPGEPNKENEDELCLMVFCVDGVWAYNDAPSDSHQYYTGKIGYICELDAVE